MITNRAFRFRLRLDADQESLAIRTCGITRVVRNACVEQRAQWGQRHRISKFDQQAELKVLKSEFPWIAEAPHHCIQQAIADVDTAFQRFFKGEAGFPQFHRRGRKDSFRFPDPKQFTVGDTWIRLPKFGFVEWVRHRDIVGTPKTVTVIREGNWWFASVLCEIDEVRPEPGSADYGERLGIDLGVAVPIMQSTGEELPIARTPPRETRRSRKLHRQLSRQQRGSANREKTIRRLRALSAHQARRRLDAAHRASAHIAARHSHVAMEDLRLLNMTKSAKGTIEAPGKKVAQKSGLNRVMLDMAHGQLKTLVRHKVLARGGTFVLVDPRNTSRRCNPCGHISAESRKNQAVFQCVSCGHQANADHNASENIRDRAFGSGVPMQGKTPTGGLPGIACESSGIARRKQEQSSPETALAA
ncbi:MAG: transposase [Burkholderiaceae bacterium]|nr:transposase [Burkholderiaceae bacterium]